MIIELTTVETAWGKSDKIFINSDKIYSFQCDQEGKGTFIRLCPEGTAAFHVNESPYYIASKLNNK